MEVQLLQVADYASTSEDGKLSIMGIFSRIKASAFPATHAEMVVVVQFSVPPAEYGRKFNVVIKLIDEDGQEIFPQTNLDQEAKRGHGFRVPNTIIAKLCGVTFQKSGIYEVSVLVDGDTKGSVPFEVVAMPVPDASRYM